MVGSPVLQHEPKIPVEAILMVTELGYQPLRGGHYGFRCGMLEQVIDELSIVSHPYEGILQHLQVSITFLLIQTDHSSALTPSLPLLKSDRAPFILTYHPNSIHIQKIISCHFRHLQRDAT
eukprot:g34625.t1